MRFVNNDLPLSPRSVPKKMHGGFGPRRSRFPMKRHISAIVGVGGVGAPKSEALVGVGGLGSPVIDLNDSMQLPTPFMLNPPDSSVHLPTPFLDWGSPKSLPSMRGLPSATTQSMLDALVIQGIGLR